MGNSGSYLVVLDQHFNALWRVHAPRLNPWIMALSPAKDQVAYISLSRAGSASLGLIGPSGSRKVLKTFQRDDRDGSYGLTWSPEGDQITFGAEGQVRTCDITHRTCEALGDGFEPTWSPNGKWIAYRNLGGRAERYDVATRKTSMLGPSRRVVSLVHWAPDSDHIMVQEELGPRKIFSPYCPNQTPLVVYGLTDGSRNEVFDPCGTRDWFCDWIADPSAWTSNASSPSGTGHNPRHD